jgi:hypothetical protein
MCFSFPCAASHWHVLGKHVTDLDDPTSVIFERCWAWKKQGIFTIGFDPPTAAYVPLHRVSNEFPFCASTDVKEDGGKQSDMKLKFLLSGFNITNA